MLKKIAFFVLIFSATIAQAQRDLPLDRDTKYEIGSIEVTGTTTYNENTVIAFTGLRVGEKLYLPGEKISNVIKKLKTLSLLLKTLLKTTIVRKGISIRRFL